MAEKKFFTIWVKLRVEKIKHDLRLEDIELTHGECVGGKVHISEP